MQSEITNHIRIPRYTCCYEVSVTSPRVVRRRRAVNERFLQELVGMGDACDPASNWGRGTARMPAMHCCFAPPTRPLDTATAFQATGGNLTTGARHHTHSQKPSAVSTYVEPRLSATEQQQCRHGPPTPAHLHAGAQPDGHARTHVSTDQRTAE